MFEYRKSIAKLEKHVSPDNFFKIRVALTLLHREHNLPMDGKMYVLALIMVKDKIDRPDAPKEFMAHYGKKNWIGDQERINKEIKSCCLFYGQSEIMDLLSTIKANDSTQH
jgi:hypothetical protein